MASDASRLVYRIKTALKGDSSGQESAKLAHHYAAAVTEANHQIKESEQALDADKLLEAYIIAHLGNNLLDTVDSLDLPETKIWNERCETFGWPSAAPLDYERTAKLKNAFNEKADIKDWLFGEYRAALRSKNKRTAFRIICVLKDRFDDEDITKEHNRIETQLRETLVKDLEFALQELMPGESASLVLEKYRSSGLTISADSKILEQALEAERRLLVDKATQEVSKIVERSEEASNPARWKALDADFLACDVFLANADLRANINPELRDRFNSVGTSLSRSRGSFESNILIQFAINELKTRLQKGRGKLGPSKINYRDAAERLRSRQDQSKKLGYPIPKPLQEEIKQVLAEAKHRRAKRLGLIGLVGIAACSILVWVGLGLSDQASQAELDKTAVTALEADGNRSSLAIAQTTLRTWQELVDSKKNDHPAAIAAGNLQKWIDQQTAFEQSYSKIADNLESLKLSGYQAGLESKAKTPLDEAETLKTKLLDTQGEEASKRIQNFKVWLADSKTRATRTRARALTIIEGELRDVIEAAKAANSPETFSAISRALSELAEKAASSSVTTRFDSLFKEAENELSIAQSNWTALENMKTRLGEAKDLPEYLAQLSSIQNFDNISSDDKRSIQRILRALPSTEAVLQQIILPDSAKGWIEFSSNKDYRRSEPEVNEVERVFLQRLANDPVFENVYKSNVKYFEGEPIAKSEYSVFLIDPISQIQTGLKTGINFSFNVRGFDELGEPEGNAREMNFLSHPDGSFWGFFYEPSELSKESKYFENTIRVALLQIIDGAPRFSALNLFEQLNQQRTLSYAFRAYWQSQIATFIQMNPWKWGSALAPTLQKQIQKLESTPQSTASKRQWLSSIEQNAPSVSLTEYFRLAAKHSLTNEAVAFARLYQNLKDGNIALLGTANAEGVATLPASASRDHAPFTIDHLTGRIVRLGESTKPAAFAPIFALSIDGDPAITALENAEIATGHSLRAESYKEHLPPALQ